MIPGRSVLKSYFQFKKLGRIWKIGLIIAVISLMVGCASPSPAPTQTLEPAPTQTPAPSSPAVTLYDESKIVTLYEESIPAVVKIEKVEREKGLLIPFEEKSQGSGFIIDQEGYILTNNHVVSGASKVKVILNDGSSLEAKVVGTAPADDLALLKVDQVKLANITPLPLGDSDLVKPGQMAIALGSPLGLEGSITVGIISGIGRSLSGPSMRPITNVLQTDAAITFGNSGGPLLNSKGEVIGINTAIEGATGIGFAIPINTAKSLLPALKKGGVVSRPWLGIKGMAITPELAEKLDLPVERGVYVIEVMADSPAEKVGLRGSGTDERGKPTFGGDIITAVDGQPLAKVEDLVAYFNTKKPGDVVSLSVYRGNQILTIKVKLEKWPEEIKKPF